MDQNPKNLTPEELKNIESQEETQVVEDAATETPTAAVENENKSEQDVDAPTEAATTPDATPETKAEDKPEAKPEEAEQPRAKESPAEDESPEKKDEHADTRSMSAEELLKYLGEMIDAEELPRGSDMRRLQNLVEKAARIASQEPQKEEDEPADTAVETIQIALINLKTRYQELRAKLKEEEKNEAEDNLAKKEEIIAGLNDLLTSASDFFTIRNERANLINRWREIGAVPENKRTSLLNRFAKVNEAFYEQSKLGDDDMVEDYRQNRMIKEELIAQAKELANDKNARRASRKLRDLQDSWKETGPVAPEFKGAMWKEFKDAATVINKKQEEYNEEIRRQQKEAFEKKKGIVDNLETLLIKIPSTPREWQKMERNINRIKDQWRNAGRVAREDRWEVDTRYRVAMDEYYHQRRTYSKSISEESGDRVERMKAILEEANEYKSSEDWHEASRWFKEQQKEWETIRDQGIPFATDRRLNRSFRRAADLFFGRMREHYAELRASREDNLVKKQEIVERLRTVWESKPADLADQITAIEAEWQSVGPVPDKKKDEVLGAYYGIMRAYRGEGSRRRKSGEGRGSNDRRRGGDRHQRDDRGGKRRGGVAWSTEPTVESGAPVDFSRSLDGMTTEQLQKERNDLKWNIKRLEAQRLQYENNMGFFQSSSDSDPVVQHVQKKIDAIQKDIDKHEKRLEGLKEAIKTSSDEAEVEATEEVKEQEQTVELPVDDTDKVPAETEELLSETTTPDGEEPSVGSLKPENPLPEAQEEDKKEETEDAPKENEENQ